MINDQNTRERALDPTRSFIVQAPAGSGKTEILTQRYLVLLSHAKKAPEEIIAITFTRKAAAEMRARIVHALEFSNQDEPDKNDYHHITWQLAKKVLKKDGELQWGLMQNPNRLRILTIDALSALLCRQTPMHTQLGSMPILCEDAKILYQVAAERCITELLPNQEYHFPLQYLLHHLDNNVEKLQALFSELLSHRDQWLPHILYACAHHQILRDVLEKSLQNIVAEKIAVAQKNLPENLRQTLLLLAHHANPACENFILSEKNPILWIVFANLFLTQDGFLRKTVDIRQGFKPTDEHKSLMLAILTELENYPDCIKSLKDIQNLPPENYTDAQWETVTALTKILPLLAAQLQLIFQEKNQIDFLELTIAALKALGDENNPTDLALYLDYRIQHLLIDEFQDTSVLHMSLLQKIISEWQPHDGRTLFLVGDPMQSIYRFRNAEVGLFLHVQQHGIAQLRLENLTLTSNFRSQENLSIWFNQTFSHVFPRTSDIATGSIPFIPAMATQKPNDNHSAHFYPIINGENIDEAKKIVEIIASIREKNPNDSVAILVRARGHLIDIIAELQKKQLPFQAIEIKSLSENMYIQDLLSLTRALLHRADRIAWLSILRAPFCGLLSHDLEYIAQASNEKTIWEAIIDCEKISGLSSDALKRLQFLRHHFLLAFQQQTFLNVSLWIEGIWLALGGPACLSSEHELEDVRAYFELLESFDTLDSLQDQCEKLFAKATQTAKNPIQIVTIHKAKGLEFDHVFLPALHKIGRSEEEKLLRWLLRINDHGKNDLIIAPIKPITEKKDAIYAYLSSVEKEKNDYEIARLLYVAATRAKKSLHLFGLLHYDEKKSQAISPKKGSFLEKLWPILEGELQNIKPLRHTMQNEEMISEQPLMLIRHARAWFPEIMTEENTAEKPISINLNITSHAATAVGTIVHELLQMICENILSMTENNFPEVLCKSRLHALGILEHEISECIERIRMAITNTIHDARGKWILHAHTDAHCEWPITHIIENKIQHWVIDRSFIDEKNTRWIIDYKTEKFSGAAKKEHQEQLHQYAAALSAMENRPIKMGLYFPMSQEWVEMHYCAHHNDAALVNP